MAIPSTAVWRVRAGGSNVNGGGYDPSVSGVQSTTLNGAISSSATTVIVASATGWPTTGNYYARIGNDWKSPETFSSGGTGGSEVVLVTAGQGTTSWTVTRAQLGTVAQAFATGVVVDNELSRCNAAIASGTAGASTASTTFTDAAGTFNSTYIGNVLWIASGTGATVGAYFIQSVTNATTVVLDRVSGTYTAGVWKVGGGWADPRTNTQSSNQIVPGNIIYLRAGGAGSGASPDYTLSAGCAIVLGDTTNGKVRVVGENVSTPASGSTAFVYIGPAAVTNVFFAFGLASAPTYNVIENVYVRSVDSSIVFLGIGECYNCVSDQNGFDADSFYIVQAAVGCEVFSSVSNTGVAGNSNAMYAGVDGTAIMECNIHDTWGRGVTIERVALFESNILSKCRGNSLMVNMLDTSAPCIILHNTIDAGHSDAITLLSSVTLARTVIAGNIISNHNQAGKHGINADFGSTTVNDRMLTLIYNNTFFNNTLNARNLTIGNGFLNGRNRDNNIGTDPGFVAQSTQNYAIGANLRNLGFPRTAFLQSKSGQTTGVRNFMDPGAVQPTGVAPVAVTGTAILDFTSTPSETAQVVITGQAGILSTSRMEVWSERGSTASNDADAHDQFSMLFNITPGDIVPGIGFTIKARTRFGFKATGTFSIPWVWS